MTLDLFYASNFFRIKSYSWPVLLKKRIQYTVKIHLTNETISFTNIRRERVNGKENYITCIVSKYKHCLTIRKHEQNNDKHLPEMRVLEVKVHRRPVVHWSERYIGGNCWEYVFCNYPSSACGFNLFCHMFCFNYV